MAFVRDLGPPDHLQADYYYRMAEERAEQSKFDNAILSNCESIKVLTQTLKKDTHLSEGDKWYFLSRLHRGNKELAWLIVNNAAGAAQLFEIIPWSELQKHKETRLLHLLLKKPEEYAKLFNPTTHITFEVFLKLFTSNSDVAEQIDSALYVFSKFFPIVSLEEFAAFPSELRQMIVKSVPPENLGHIIKLIGIETFLKLPQDPDLLKKIVDAPYWFHQLFKTLPFRRFLASPLKDQMTQYPEQCADLFAVVSFSRIAELPSEIAQRLISKGSGYAKLFSTPGCRWQNYFLIMDDPAYQEDFRRYDQDPGGYSELFSEGAGCYFSTFHTFESSLKDKIGENPKEIGEVLRAIGLKKFLELWEVPEFKSHLAKNASGFKTLFETIGWDQFHHLLTQVSPKVQQVIWDSPDNLSRLFFRTFMKPDSFLQCKAEDQLLFVDKSYYFASLFAVITPADWYLIDPEFREVVAKNPGLYETSFSKGNFEKFKALPKENQANPEKSQRHWIENPRDHFPPGIKTGY